MTISHHEPMTGSDVDSDGLSAAWTSSLAELRRMMLGREREDVRADGTSGDDVDGGDGLTRTVRALCGEARRNGLRAEEMVVRLKRVWHALPLDGRVPARADADALSRAVSLCIAEYYRE